MRLILEKADIIKVLEAHFDQKFPEEMVQVRAQPFEVELTGIPMTEPESPKKKGAVAPAAAPAAHTLGAEDGFDGPVRVTPPDLQPDADNVVEMRTERNVSTTPPPYDPSETADDPTSILRQSRALESELGAERSSGML